MPSPPSFVASFDSATTMADATAACLRGEPYPALGNPPQLRPLAKATSALPKKARAKLYIGGGAAETVSPRRVHRLDFSEVDDWLAAAYPEGKYPAVAIGSSNGALSHLYAAMNIPWLPQTLLVPVRQRVHPDDPTKAMEKGSKYGAKMMRHQPELQLHHMHDANQDRLMVRALTYFRVKRRVLGEGYERFLRERLVPGGTIVIVDCGLSWGTTRIGERHVYQHGALGGATEEEFHHGSERVAKYLEREGSPVREWDGPQPDGRSPEAEWGFEQALAEDIERFAQQHGYRVVRIRFDEPEDTSPMVADLYRWWYRRRRIPANRLVVSSFMLMEPYWTLRTGSVPFWMVFNMDPSLRALDDYLHKVEPYDDIYLSLFQHGVEAVGLPPKQEWLSVLDHARSQGHLLGVDLDEYPLDLGHYARHDQALEDLIPARYPLSAPLSIDEVEAFLGEHGERYAVRLTQ